MRSVITMANTPSLNDSNLCFGIASPTNDRPGLVRTCDFTCQRYRRPDLPQEGRCRGLRRRLLSYDQDGLRLVMAWLELLPVAFVAILGLVALYALSRGPARQ